MKEPQTARRRILVDHTFQIGILLRLAGTLVVCFVLSLAMVLAAPLALAIRGDAPLWVSEVLHHRLLVLRELVAAPLVCSLLVFFAHGVFETFKVAGPLNRLARVLEELRELKLPGRLAAREKDYLADSIAGLDAALGAFAVHVRACQEASARSVAAAHEAGQGDAQAGARRDRSLEELHALLMQFQLPEVTRTEEPVPALPPEEPVAASEGAP